MTNYPSLFQLTNKIAYVTGGCGLIGKEISIALKQAGATVVILDINESEGQKFINILEKTGLKVFFEKFDVTDLYNLKKNLYRLFKRYNGVDIFINNAYPRTKDWGNKVEDVVLESAIKNTEMHLISYIWASRITAIFMNDNKIKGSIINMGSIYGIQGNDFTVYEGTDLTSPMEYSFIKGGIINYSRYLASYFGSSRIRVNNVCPGGIFNGQNPIFVRNYEKKVPLKRMGKSEDIAASCVFLASEASSYITGQTIIVDGGWSII